MSDAVGRSPGERDTVWQRRYRTLLTLLGLTGLVLVLLLIALGIWWRGLQEQRLLARSLLAPHPGPQPTQPLPVAVVTPTRAVVAETVRLSVTRAVSAGRRVTAPAAGRLVSLAPSGARAEAGQVVARVETSRRVAVRPPRADRARRYQTAAQPARKVLRAAQVRVVQAARRRLERAVQATRLAGQKLAAARQAQGRRPEIQAATGREVADSEAAVARARSELEECDSALRVSERLYRAGAAARAEVTADAEARAAAARRLVQAQERARAARPIPAASLSSAAASPTPDLAAAERQVARARSEVDAAREALRAAARPAPSAPATLPAGDDRRQAPPGAGQTLGWKEVLRTIAIRTPVGGTVTRLSARTGSRVSPGAGLLSIAIGNGSEYRAVAPASRLRGIRLPTSAQLRASTGESVPARVSALAAPKADSILLRVAPQPRGASAVGRLATAKQLWVELKAPGPDRTLGVPGKAIHARPEGPVVWLARRTAHNGNAVWRAHRQSVQVSRREGETAIISRGLKPDSRVIIAGTEQLREGQTVAAIPWRLP